MTAHIIVAMAAGVCRGILAFRKVQDPALRATATSFCPADFKSIMSITSANNIRLSKSMAVLGLRERGERCRSSLMQEPTMKTIIQPDASVALALFAFAAAIIARLTATKRSPHSADDVAAIVATSGHPSGT
jgi:hypothetical protein